MYLLVGEVKAINGTEKWGGKFQVLYRIVYPLPANLPELRDKTQEVVSAITLDMLIKVWEELAYRL